MPKERPILFQGEMVRAILSGKKTQTRRTVKPGKGVAAWRTPKTIDAVKRWDKSEVEDWWTMAVGEEKRIVHCGNEIDGGHIGSMRCPYGVPGDRLWVRESFSYGHPVQFTGAHDRPSKESTSGIPGPPHVDYRYVYRADGELPPIYHCRQHPFRALQPETAPGTLLSEPERMCWTPSIHMPRIASRLTLEVTNVRVERLQDISKEDALSEGVPLNIPAEMCADPVAEYRELWDRINGKTAPWSGSPWVWVVSFERVPEQHLAALEAL